MGFMRNEYRDSIPESGSKKAKMTRHDNTASSFGVRLKHWRKRRGLSQLELSCRAEVGQRHLSFIESGRSRPGESVVYRLAKALSLPLREQNALLSAAGFAAPWSEIRLDEADAAPFRQLIEEMLTRQMPYPAYALDRYWNVVMANPTATALFNALGGAHGSGNFIELLLENPKAVQTILNHDEVLGIIADDIARDVARFPDDAVLQSLYERLIRTSASHLPTSRSEIRPTVMVAMQIGETRVNTISAIARFFGAQDVCVDELKVELVYPADDISRAFFDSLGAPPC